MHSKPLLSMPPSCSCHPIHPFYIPIFRSTHKDPVVVFDVEANEDVCFKLSTNSSPSDNPMQSEIMGHIGGKGNHFCRKCDVGGNKLHKESNDGYHCLFKVIICIYRSTVMANKLTAWNSKNGCWYIGRTQETS